MNAATEPGVPERVGAVVAGAFIDANGWDEIGRRIGGWVQSRESRGIALCNVHSVVTATTDPSFARALTSADLCVPDGAPVAWVLRRCGFPEQPRIGGPDLTEFLCGRAAENGWPVYFYGSSPTTLANLSKNLARRWPDLVVAGMHSPPFRPLSLEEDEADVVRINESGARILFVGLGCPKQEVWMSEHAGRVRAVSLGVGAAFDFLAGQVSRAPRWMQAAGFEWLHRLLSEPHRLWRRYLVTNTMFIAWVAGVWLRNGCSFRRSRSAGR